MSSNQSSKPLSGILRLNLRFQLILTAAFVGVCGGGVAVLLNQGIHYGEHWIHSLKDQWFSFLLPGLGAMAAVVFLRYVMKEQDDHGVPEVTYSIAKRGGLLRLRSSISRLVSCLLTVASGGSAGPESPIIVSGASVGSNIASHFHFRDRQRVVIVGCGTAAAVAAIFNAPATGIIFTMEVILGEWTTVNLVPVAIASVVGTVVSRSFQGEQIAFMHRAFEVSYTDLIACIGLSIFIAVASVLFIRTLRFFEHRAHKVIQPLWIRAAVGGILVGGIGIFIPNILGEGYSEIKSILNNSYGPGLFIIGGFIVAKIFATAITLSSGGVGGVFAPSLVIGSMTGLFFQRALTAVFPNVMWADEGYFGLLGMAGIVSCVLQAPLTGIFLILEITAGYEVLLSVVLVSTLSSSLSHLFEPVSIYHRKKLEGIKKIRSDARILSEIKVMEVVETNCTIVHPEMPLSELVKVVEQSHRNYFPVEDAESGDFVGMVHLATIYAYIFDASMREALLVEDVMDRDAKTVSPESKMQEILQHMDETRTWSLPVVKNNRFHGLISKGILLNYYRKELISQESDEL